MVANSDSSAGRALGLSEALERPWVIALLYAALTALALYPIFAVTVPPLIDYPNHLARVHVMAAWDTTPALQQNYQVQWPLQPNLAMDLLLAPISRTLAIYDAGRVFIALTLLTLIGGVLTLQKVVQGRIGLWPALLFLPLYNTVLFWGFLNFLFGTGLCLFALSAWIAIGRRNVWLRLAVFSLVSVALFFTHLLAIGLYGLAVLGYELWQVRADGSRWSRRRLQDWFAAGGQFVLPFLLFLAWFAGNAKTGPGSTDYGTWELKLYALLAPVSFGMPSFDIGCGLVLLLMLVWAWQNRSVTFAPELTGPVIAIAIAALLTPNRLGGVWGIDFRVPVLLTLAAVAGVRIGPSARRLSYVIVSIVTALFVYRIAAVAESWRIVDQRYDEFRQATLAMDVGSSLLVVMDQEDWKTDPAKTDLRSYKHMASLAVIERDVFLPNLFTGHTTVRASPARTPIDAPVGQSISRAHLVTGARPETAAYPLGFQLNRYMRAYWTDWPGHFDYVLVIRFQNTINPLPARLEPVHVGSYFDIYRVVRQTPPDNEG